MKIQTLIALLSFLLFCGSVWAQSENQLPIEFKPGAYVNGTDTLPYQLVLPDNYQPDQTYPLMVLLHGSGERGRDNQLQLKHFLPLVNNGTLRKRYPFIYIIPQCPAEQSWSNYLRNRDSINYRMPAKPTRPLQALHGLLELVKQKYKIDQQHSYISGLSMGGFGTLEYLTYYPGFFKAGVPICGGLHQDHFKKLKTPIWLVHGDMDPVVKVGFSRKLVDYLKEHKKPYVYTELAGVTHNSWAATYANPLWADWLWAQP